MSHEAIADMFDQWASSGRDSDMESGHGDVVSQVLKKLDFRPGEQILDLGCGNGWATRMMAKAAAGATAVGIDASPKMIARADELHSFTIRARYEVGAFEALDFPDGKFDRIFSMEALYYAVDLEQSLAEMLRVLKPGGACDVVLDYYEENTASKGWPEATGLNLHSRSEAGWREAFEAVGFEHVRTERVIDSRGPGDPQAFECDECVPDYEAQRALHAAGSLWIHARKP